MSRESQLQSTNEVYRQKFSAIFDSIKDLDKPGIIFMICGIITLLIIIFVIGFVFYTAWPTFQREGLNFIFGSDWDYNQNQYGSLVFIGGTIALTIVTIAIACPLSILTAIFLAEYSPAPVTKILRPMIELLVGIPSVVYGIFGLFVLESMFKNNINPGISSILGFIPIFRNLQPYTGTGLLLASVILSIMILPTITSLSIEAIYSVPREYKEASISLGATKWETIKKTVLPVASPGIISAVVLGIMRAMGETMAVVMLFGSQMHVPGSLFDTGYAMTSKILNDIGYWVAVPEAQSALFGLAAILIFFEVITVAAARIIGGRRKWS
jgi:phosphate transport system permease protein